MAAVTSDQELWGRAGAGDGDAFGELFDRHCDAIYNYLFRRTGDWSVAEDLTSVVFLEAWRRRRDLRLESASALPWLFGVATNVVRNERRSRRRHRVALARLPKERAELDIAERVIDRVESEQTMREALALLVRLPKEQQDVFALCGWSELSYEAAALALGIPVGTVRSRLSRARARLAELVVANGLEASRGATDARVA